MPPPIPRSPIDTLRMSMLQDCGICVGTGNAEVVHDALSEVPDACQTCFGTGRVMNQKGLAFVSFLKRYWDKV